jgi:magnesium transporter
MLYLSQLLGTPVEDAQNVRLGKIIDVLLKPEDVGSSTATYPSALLVEGEEDLPWRVPAVAVEWEDDVLRLRVLASELTRLAASEQDVCLAQEVLDKQVIDIERKKTVRVNDVCFADDWQILGIDNSNLGLIRRIAPGWLLGKGRNAPANLIPWERIELINSQQQEQLGAMGTVETAARMPSRQLSGHLADLHPADIAQIVHQLTPAQGARLLEGLDDETAADTMEEIDTDLQRDILANLQPQRAATILQEMEPDEIADLLARLPEERSQELLRLINPEESEDVQELLEYESDTAGGMMTPDYVALNQGRTVAEALESVRRNIQENDIRLPYIYCVADETQDECQVLGVVSLWDLLVAVPTQRLQELMETDIITVEPDRDGREVAEIMAKYNLLAIPVVSAEGAIEGVVTVDDAIDMLLPAERRRRPSSMY